MQVKQGWSAEVKAGRWAKHDVLLDETDLQRIMAAVGWPCGLADLDVATAYQLLDVEAEYLLTATLITRYGYDGHARLGELDAIKARLVAKLRGRDE